MRLAGLEDAFLPLRIAAGREGLLEYSGQALKGNEPARKLYESLGFTVVGIETGKMPGNEDFIVQVYSMEKL